MFYIFQELEYRKRVLKKSKTGKHSPRLKYGTGSVLYSRPRYPSRSRPGQKMKRSSGKVKERKRSVSASPTVGRRTGRGMFMAG